ncbi:endonuclease/exonuclease/phosphatase family protein [Paracoccus sp. MBLB3053]|uniref:Endonuclease/exonuclease/phosphatase family protein n=1 Tax=Paracoccus aurantius TaxID=3073814 RepID=A0ABU2HPB5_9RHOB|nr:endonuclease/exonuclease/phosphatase family protein [Paracoccus sp. MBLB3053]MDS9466592.1 endonuclease/exonuclease/phosphatase family protein [Paracoccus sp. MBLB3053]
MGLRTLAAVAIVAAFGLTAKADPLRIATFSPDLSRDGPGLLFRDLGRDDPQIAAVIRVIGEARPDILLLTGFDWDHDGLALAAFQKRLGGSDLDYPYSFAARPNAGIPTGLDLNGDGRLGGPADRQGFGRFSGQGGMAILSRHPVGAVTNYSELLWQELAGNLMPDTPAEVAAIQRLSSVAHWDASIMVDGRPLHLLAMSATPPVFDGPEDRNGRRNHDELAFWLDHLPDTDFVLAGKLNIDAVDGDGRPEALSRIMDFVQDTEPRSRGGKVAGAASKNAGQKGDPALDTADWPGARAPGNLRVDYVLPKKGLRVIGSGVLWPEGGELADVAQEASAHRLVWVEIDW